VLLEIWIRRKERKKKQEEREWSCEGKWKGNWPGNFERTYIGLLWVHHSYDLQNWVRNHVSLLLVEVLLEEDRICLGLSKKKP
jgi:hypothetical protein